MKLLVLVVAAVLGGQSIAKPQVFMSHATGKPVATYTPETETIHISKTAPPTLRICIKQVCQTPAQWLAK